MVVVLVLGLFEANSATEKSGGKRDIIYSGGAWYLIIILILLIKMLAIYMEFSQIHI